MLHEAQRVLIVRQSGGNIAMTIDELYGQRSFNDAERIADGEFASDALAEGRYAHFIERGYRMAGHTWGIFSLDRLSRTPEFRQAAA